MKSAAPGVLLGNWVFRELLLVLWRGRNLSMQVTDEEDIEKIEVNLFLEALFQRYGYDLRNYTRSSVRRRIRHLMSHSGHKHISDLIGHVLRDETFAHQVMLE